MWLECGRVLFRSGSFWGRRRVMRGRVGSGSGSCPRRVGVVLGSIPCQVGPCRVGVWVESGTGRGRIRVDSVIRWGGTAGLLGQLGVGWGPLLERKRDKMGADGWGAGLRRIRCRVRLGEHPG